MATVSAAAASAAAEAASISQQPLDVEFAMTMRSIDTALSVVLDRHLRIRGEQWAQRLGLLAKLRQPLFQKDRNLHADLLLKCIQEGHWSEPMNKHPPEGPLPSLPRHVACTLRRERLDRRLVAGTETQRDEGVQTDGPTVSLAQTAAAATGTAYGGYGYSRALAARLAQLELQNKQLRKQLEAVVRSRSTSPGRSPMVSRRSQDTLMPSTPVQTPRMKAASNGAKSQVSVQRTMVSPKSPRNMVKPRWEIEPSTLVSHAEAPADTEAFLKYLDVFQAQARSLIQSQN